MGRGRNILACQMLQKEASNQSFELREEGLRGGPFLFRKWRLIDLHGWAGANQVLISIDVIDPSNGWPEFVLWFHEGQWKCCHLSRIGPIPVGGCDTGQGVWRHLQGVDPRVNAALLYVGDFLPDADHSVTESVQLCLVF